MVWSRATETTADGAKLLPFIPSFFLATILCKKKPQGVPLPLNFQISERYPGWTRGGLSKLEASVFFRQQPYISGPILLPPPPIFPPRHSTNPGLPPPPKPATPGARPHPNLNFNPDPLPSRPGKVPIHLPHVVSCHLWSLHLDPTPGRLCGRT